MEIVQANWIFAHPLWSNSCIGADGRLNKKRAEYYVKVARMCGATMFRVLAGLLIDTRIFKNWTINDMRSYNYLPWEFDTRVWKFDLSKRNKIYLENLAAFCEILKSHDMGIVMSLYDRCHWNQWKKLKGGEWIEGRVPHSPFHLNVNGVDDMFVRTVWHDEYERDVIETLIASGCRFWIEPCNEPRVDAQTYINFTRPIISKCKLAGIKQNQLLSGIEWFFNGKKNAEYTPWRHAIDFTDSFEGGRKDIEVGYTVIHGFPEDFLTNEDLANKAKHSQRVFVSTDGQIISADALEKELILYRKYERQGRLKRWGFEALYQGIGADLYVLAGISRALGLTTNIDYSLVDPGNDPDDIQPGPGPGPKPGPTPGPPPPPPLPQTWWQKHWRWVIGVGAMVAGSLMAVFGATWYIRLAGAVIPWATAYLKVMRQNIIEI